MEKFVPKSFLQEVDQWFYQEFLGKIFQPQVNVRNMADT